MLTSVTSTFALHIVSAEGGVYSGEARMIVVPGKSGGMGIMASHAPLLATLKPGEVNITNADGETEFLYVSGGYIEVQPHNVTILADTALRGDDVDEQAALDAKNRAEEVVKSARLFVDRDRAQLELLKAIAQLKVLEHTRRSKSRGL